MSFLSPHAFLLFFLLLSLGSYIFLKKKSIHRMNLTKLSAPSSLIINSTKQTRRWFRILFALNFLSLTLIIFVIARPAVPKISTKRWTEGIDIMLALDVSDSMDATDFKPNRITVAKQVIDDFITNREQDRIGLVIFGGEAVTKSPLTSDYHFLRTQVDSIELRELDQGTAIGMAISNSVGRLRQSKSKNKVIILFTDGDNNVGDINPITAAQLAKEEGIKIYCIGIGKQNRVVVPVWNQSKTIILTKVPSYLNPQLLEDIASMTGGKSYMATDEDSLSKILIEIDQLEKTKTQVSVSRRMDEIFFNFALLAFFVLLIIYSLLETRFKRINRETYASAA